MYAIYTGKVIKLQPFGAFVKLIAPLNNPTLKKNYRDGMLHISRIVRDRRVEAIEDVIQVDDDVFVKVVEVDPRDGKTGLDMRFVSQADGEDLDPTNEKAGERKLVVFCIILYPFSVLVALDGTVLTAGPGARPCPVLTPFILVKLRV
jgi:predicted RNA-binding protein with RPS1 domain